jgi:hypothetical protein
MKRLRELNQYRDKAWERRMTGRTAAEMGVQDTVGAFRLQGPCGAELRLVVSAEEGWDHVSVSTTLPRCPNWTEMEFVKRLFFRPDEVAMQLHVPPKDHISVHPHCLHLWRPHEPASIPLPPKEFVG